MSSRRMASLAAMFLTVLGCIALTLADDDGERGRPAPAKTSGGAGSGAVCAKCHSDGRSGTAPHALPATAPAPAPAASSSNAAACAKCHNDGRSGKAPHAMPAGISAKGSAKATVKPPAPVATPAPKAAAAAGASSAQTCTPCHTDGRSGKAPHAIPPGGSATSGSTTAVNNGAAVINVAGGSSAQQACTPCHTDGRTGTAPHAIPPGGSGTTTGTGTVASTSGASGSSGQQTCTPCHTDGRTGKAPHPIPPTGGSTGGSGTASNYAVIAWSDLGMHSLSTRFDEMAIMPPYNDVIAQVIQKGSPPKLVTAGVTVQYELVDNTTVTGKSDFWKYVYPLFGVTVAEGLGLTGNKLSGTMKFNKDRWEATGIPALPLDDARRWNPYQKAKITVSDKTGTLASTTTIVVPVSDEMNCAKCHGASTGTMETNVLSLHDRNHGTQLLASRPVLCANCHADNALGAKGVDSISSLSVAMHGKHATMMAKLPACYDCHPGDRTRFNRSKLKGMGPEDGTDPHCENCHGDLVQVAATAVQGRAPWNKEPACSQCHGSKYNTTAMYRQSKGHGNLYCAACHNSPHAWYPSNLADDNAQPIALQGKAAPIGNCMTCHTSIPKGGGPHK